MELMGSVSSSKTMEIFSHMKAHGSKINTTAKDHNSLYQPQNRKPNNSLDGLKETGKMENFKEKVVSESTITQLSNGKSSTKANSYKAINMGKVLRYSMEIGMKEISRMDADMDLEGWLMVMEISTMEILSKDSQKEKDSNWREEWYA